ncbi:MAG: septum formation protein Maf [Gemmatimonadetes bacterium]|nr:septum formation protein Maf [Gemmatimonadota bacterium]
MTPPALVLASASPRRAALLTMLGLPHEVLPADVDETLLPGEDPAAHVERLARAKAAAVALRRSDALVIGGDTVVVIDGEVLGKPARRQDAVATLLRLAGREHIVFSGLALVLPGGATHAAVSRTRVRFRDFDEPTARRYVGTGEPLDKAGSYGIQGLGAALIESIEGDYFTVVGFPIPDFIRLLERAGWRYDFGSLEALKAPSRA